MKKYIYLGKKESASIEQVFFTSEMAMRKAQDMLDHGFTHYEIKVIIDNDLR